jgi:hypothetical protein
MKLGYAVRTETLAKHVERVVLVLLQLFGITGDERSRGLDPQFRGGAEYRVDQVEVQVLLANALHAYGSRLDTEVEPDAARFGHSRKKRDVDAVDSSGCPPAIAAAHDGVTKLNHLSPVGGKHIVIELEVGISVARVQDIEFLHQAIGGFQTKAALKKSGGRAESAGERAPPSGFDPQQLEPELRDRIMVVRRDRKCIQVINLRFAVSGADAGVPA